MLLFSLLSRVCRRPLQALLSDSNAEIDGRIEGRKEADDREFQKIDDMVRDGKAESYNMWRKYDRPRAHAS